MWVYWFMFIVPAAAAVLLSSPQPAGERGIRKGAPKDRQLGPWILVGVVVALLVGFRFQVGGDWSNYVEYIYQAQGATLSELLAESDPGYQLLNWIAIELDWGIYGVNLMGGIAFATGLVLFCRSLPRPWLALTVAVPYLVIVVAMGYSRQGIALGFAMIALVALQRKRTIWFLFWILVGATFHKTAVLLLPIAGLANSRKRLASLVWVAVVSLVAYRLFLEDSIQILYENYVEAQYESEGAFVRLMMNALPAVILLWYRKKFRFPAGEDQLWRWMALISLALLVLLLATPSSTAVDRIALYMLPLQMVVFSRLPLVLGESDGPNYGWVTAIVGFYFLVQFVWLNFAANASHWLPYRFYPLEAL